MKINIINSRLNLKNNLTKLVENKTIQLICFNTIDKTNSPKSIQNI